MATLNEFELLVKRYQSLIRELTSVLKSVSKQSIGFEIEEILAVEEEIAQEQGVDKLLVTSLDTDVVSIHSNVCNSLSTIYKTDPAYSTRFVSRFPGLILVENEHDTIRKLVAEINSLKHEMGLAVRYVDETPIGDKAHDKNLRTRDKYQRHQFVHKVLPGVMTEQLYRNIHIIEEEVTNCWFNWTQRQVPKNYFQDDVHAFLNFLKERPQENFTFEQWDMKIEGIRERLSEFHYLQKKRVLRHMPICTYQYKDEQGKLVRNTKNATTPFLLLNQKSKALPTYSDLKNWDSSERNKKQRVERSNPNYSKTLLLNEPKLYGVIDLSEEGQQTRKFLK